VFSEVVPSAVPPYKYKSVPTTANIPYTLAAGNVFTEVVNVVGAAKVAVSIESKTVFPIPMQPTTPETTPQTRELPIIYEGLTKEAWAEHFGVGPKTVMVFINAAVQGVVSSDETIRSA
jgi:hypothetical protein